MALKVKFIDMRRHRRFRADGNALAAFYTDLHNFIKLGQIIDISLGGLAIRYIALGEETQAPGVLELFGSSGCIAHLTEVPCKVVYDYEISDESWGMLKVRRCGVKFGELTQKQLSRLHAFIQAYALREDGRDSVRDFEARRALMPAC